MAAYALLSPCLLRRLYSFDGCVRRGRYRKIMIPVLTLQVMVY
jgi:hypothetical protein